MRILHVAASDRMGGAAIAAYRQHQALLQKGIESSFWVKLKVTNDPSVHVFRPPPALRFRLPRVLWRYHLKSLLPKRINAAPFSDDRSESRGSECEHLPPHDVINIHWTSGFLDQPSLFKRHPAAIPIVVTMHDMNPFTGGCHYDMGCGRFVDHCGNCPQLGNKMERDLSRSIWSRKHYSYSSRPAKLSHFVADSRWLAQEARRSSLLQSLPVSMIHYGVDTKIYQPISRQYARQFLGIPAESHVLMFAADGVTDERKGGRYLYEALAHVKSPIFILTAGRGYPPSIGVPSLHLGNVECEHLMALAYNAADVFAIPSIQEAFGQTALEAAACGVPVVGFAAGGIPDVVLSGETGLLCPVKDAAALGAAIQKLLSNEPMRNKMGMRAREYVEANFTFGLQADKYIHLYEDLLKAV